MKRKKLKSLPLVLAIFMVGLSAHAVEPMSEEAMGSMALESGQNFTQIYGPTSAGLSVDTEGSGTLDGATKTSTNDTDDTAILATKQSISDLEKQFIDEFETAKANGDFDLGQAEIIKSGSLVVGQAGAFDTTSEIRYKDGAYKHDATFNQDGSVKHTRDLQIDMLKFENLSSDNLNDNTFGSIYISDWSSRGSNTTTER